MAERYFSKSNGRILKAFLFSTLIIAMLLLANPVFASDSSENMPQTTVCTWNGNSYYPGQYFYNSAGQQFLCYSDGTYHFTGVTMVPSSYYLSYSSYPTCTTTCNSYSCYMTCSQGSTYYPYNVYYYPYYSPNVLATNPYYYYYYYPTSN